ncbi:MAG: hypothetical protein KDA46_11490, partial [Parvularculaceae bacterium]|nr:hypothetical protein [Parvularculaceae bacterium]
MSDYEYSGNRQFFQDRNMTTNYTTHIQQLDNAHHLHPFSKHHELREQKPRVITRGEGVYLWDSEGNKILDGMAGLWCV